MVETITQNQARHIVKYYKGNQFFTVTFVKRGNGEERTMNCRKGVHKHLKGGSLKFNPADKGVVIVWDRPKKAYRSVTLDQILRINIVGKKYTVSK